MSRTIADLPLGSVVVLLEDGVNTNYILVNKDANGCEILRELTYATRRMNPTNTTVYETSEMDAYLSNEETGFLSLFDAATRSAISARSISTFTFGDTEAHYISRKCYLPSYGAVFNTTSTELEPDASYLWALSDWRKTFNVNSMRIAYTPAESAVSWWLRSPYSATYFYSVNASGSSSSSYASYAGCALRPALNVAPDTIVSDEGADIIYLLPSERAHTVEFKGKLGDFSNLPKIGCSSVVSGNLTNVTIKVTNNYGDAVPVWQTVQDGVQFEFQNATKETTDWQVGIWCYGEAVNLSQGYFEQPQLLVGV